MSSISRDKKQLLQAIYNNPSLSAQEKQRQMQLLMKGETLTPSSRNLMGSTPSTSTVASKPAGKPRISLLDTGREPSGLDLEMIRASSAQPAMVEEPSKPATNPPTVDVDDRNRLIKEIYMDKSLTGIEKQKRIQAIMKGQTLQPSSPTPAPVAPSLTISNSASTAPLLAGGMTDVQARNRAIKEVYMDKSLSGIEKQKKIQAIMKGQFLKPSSRNVGEPAPTVSYPQPAPVEPYEPSAMPDSDDDSVPSPPVSPKDDLVLDPAPGGSPSPPRSDSPSTEPYEPSAMPDSDDDSVPPPVSPEHDVVLDPAPGSPHSTSPPRSDVDSMRDEQSGDPSMGMSIDSTVKATPFAAQPKRTTSPSPSPSPPYSSPSPPEEPKKKQTAPPSPPSLSPPPVEQKIATPSPSRKRPTLSPPPTPPKGPAAASHRREIVALYKDTSLTALEKKGKMKEVISRAPPPEEPSPSPQKPPSRSISASTSSRSPSRSASAPPSRSRTPDSRSPSVPESRSRTPSSQSTSPPPRSFSSKRSPTPSSPSPPPKKQKESSTKAPAATAAVAAPSSVIDDASKKRAAIVAIHKDTSLTPKEKQLRVQEIMKGGGSTGNASGIPAPAASSSLTPARSRSPSSSLPPSRSPSPPPSRSPSSRSLSRSRTPSSTPPSRSRTPSSRTPSRSRTPSSSLPPSRSRTPSYSLPPSRSRTPSSRSSSPPSRSFSSKRSPTTRSPSPPTKKQKEFTKGALVDAAGAVGLAAGAAVAAAPSPPKQGMEVPKYAAKPPPAPAPPPDPAASRRSMIMAITRDKSITPQERQRRIQEIMRGGAISGNARGPDLQTEEDAIANAVATSKRESTAIIQPLTDIPSGVDSDSEPEPEAAPARVMDEAAKRRAAIVAIHKDRSLTPKEKQLRIQEIMKGGSSAGNASGTPAPAAAPRAAEVPAPAVPEAAPAEETAEEAASRKRLAIQTVFKDTMLTPQEKHQRVQAIQRGETVPAPAGAPATAPGAAVSVAAASQGRSRRRSGSGSRSGSRSGSGSQSESRSESGSRWRSQSGSRNYSDSRSRSSSRSYSDSRSRSYSDSRSRSDSRSYSDSRSRSYSSGSRSDSRTYSSRSGSDSRSYSSRSGSDSRSYTSDESSYSDEASREEGMLIDAEVAAPKPEDMRLFPTATAKVDSDTDTDSEYEDRGDPKRRLFCCICLCIILIGAVGGPLLATYWDEVSLWFDEIISGTQAPAPVPISTEAPTITVTPAPTMATPAPTAQPLYPKNSVSDCDKIAEGEDVPTQDLLISQPFDIRMDVSLTLQLSDLTEVVDEMESRLQRILAPKLADCEGARRFLRDAVTRRLQIEKNVIGNARFEAQYQEDRACDASAPTPCIRVLTKLNLFLKGEEDVLALANRITEVFGEGELTTILGLTAPFSEIEVVGVTAAAPTDPPTVSDPPSAGPDIVETPAPSVAPEPSPAPTPPPTPVPTVAPTSTNAPTRGRRGQIEEALLALGDLDSLNSNALDYLLDRDSWTPRSGRTGSAVWTQRYAMLAVWENLRGWDWFKLDDWLDPDDSACTWHGIRCNIDDEIVQIELNDNNLSGRIPTEIALLTGLTHLNLAKNELDGPIPTEMGFLTNLRYLNLIDTDLTGTLPTELATMKAIQTMNIDDNSLVGTIPTQFGLLENLFNISLWNNQLDQGIPTELGQCTKLTEIRLSDNRFSSTIPTEFFALTSLKVIELDDNFLTGSISEGVAQLTALTRLELDTNRLTGVVPALPASLTNFKCQLEENSFSNVDNARTVNCDV